MNSPGAEPGNKTRISKKQLQYFCDLVYDEAGLLLNNEKYRKRLADKILKRMKKLEIEEPQKYYEYLWFTEESNKELRKLINTCVVNETLFYRYKKQLKILQNKIFPKLIRSRQKDNSAPLKILSAGCSTGAEPYSLAITYLEVCKNLGFDQNNPGLKIIGADVSEKALKKARKGEYSPRVAENAPKSIVKKYFKKRKNNYRLIHSVKRLVNFRYLNLADSKLPRHLDMIFCRNVLIYLDKYVRNKIIHKFHRSLKNKGLLLLGPAELVTPPGEFFKAYQENNLQIFTKWTTDCQLISIWENPKTTVESSKERTENYSKNDKQRPNHVTPPPEIKSVKSPDGKKQFIEIKGIIDNNIPYKKFRKILNRKIIPGKMIYFVDLLKVKHISNIQLRQIGSVLKKLKHEEGAKTVIITKEEKIRKWLLANPKTKNPKPRSNRPKFAPPLKNSL